MSALRAVLRELYGLFVDDWGFALAIVALVACVGALRALLPQFSLAAGAILLAGCLGLLVVNAISTARR